MKSIVSVFDTSICSYNIGNEIIMDSVFKILDELCPETHLIRLPATDISKVARRYNALSEFTFVGGTNILKNDLRHNREWELNFHNIVMLRNIVLLGCGWFQYESDTPTKYTTWGLKKILSQHYIHSVRDSYTQKKLESIGIRAINTGCPTLWDISKEVEARIPVNPRSKVVFTLTDYNKDPERDLQMLRSCEKVYQEGLICFPQGTGDYEYIRDLGYGDKVTYIQPRLSAYDELLQSGTVDYVGTRLHAGIRALQYSVRSFILGIDNRSIEMGNDFKLPVIHLDSISELQRVVQTPYRCDLCLPLEKINAWKAQFR